MAGNPGSEGPGRYLRLFDVRIAREHGITGALVYEEIRRFCARNQAEGIDDVKHGDKHYCYTSAQRIAKHLELSPSTVERKLKNLCAAGLIHKKARTGTAVDNNNPKALLYYAEDYGQFTHQAKTPNAYRQNEGTPYRQNEGTERKYLERSNKSADLKDQTTSAKARPKEAAFSCERVKARPKTKPQRVPYAQNGHRVRNTDGFQSIGQFVDNLDETTKRIEEWNETVPANSEERQAAIDACKENLRTDTTDAQQPIQETDRSEQQPLYRAVPFTAEQTRYFAEAQAETIAGILAETHDTLVPDLRNVVAMLLDSRVVPQNIRGPIEAGRRGEYKYAVLYAWYVLLDALPKQPMVIEAPIGLGHEAAG